MEQDEHPRKRLKRSPIDQPPDATEAISELGANGLASLHRSITPPSSRSRRPPSNLQPRTSTGKEDTTQSGEPVGNRPRLIPSPIQLTHIRDLSAASGNNVDTVRLRDILGDPMIRECWQFNFLFDVDFLMNQFDEDVRRLVQVKVVHGSWKKDAPNRIRIEEACPRYPNVEAIVAYMPEPFGTHHSKMMILLRHDDLAQVVIHTANMIPGDWANMCQAVWRSPLLPLQKVEHIAEEPGTIGSGARFKRDLLAYLNEYGAKKTGPLVKQLARFDFSSVRAALIASVPSKQKLASLDLQRKTLWGWPALRETTRQIPLTREQGSETATPHIITQISSIATLGQTDKWLKDVFFNSLAPTSNPTPPTKSKYSIVFPTPDEIRRSLNGYGSGGSIHMKLQSTTQHKQLQYMRPYLRHWAGDSSTHSSDGRGETSTTKTQEAGRRRAAPHIKTYIRFADANRMNAIDWAMVTSANLSTQAWGAAVNSNGEVRICSWEVGVMVWPQLFAEKAEQQQQQAMMVPCFRRDLPVDCPVQPAKCDVLVGLRMPYDLPLTSYRADEVPWCATATHMEPDWLGQTWEG
ncbi:tyrosyl-DNA phosphodiesterase 1 [Aspergillus clavatus NRRL 1]|uniref:Tyrosyl-DNA phosphodiesterase, putative n=1 Tax=Aspergillus clavatus (strain ATCC 1007 / CBS 513.65 / DSM 816 / NCTC 3887 / NRRL 1 / QM 1276 / 107) TaxID=344612 RepID=A1C6F1_ASPCL|nr:tyrosyl-DNA phosphodiesterase, putative [Aspergillus clavatus NRRL 1]EAW13972.1 tyrosyl-DNA phosphodiesterase, putative [Aspergillus clavatus NRRL 1]